jgi:hypothetical protein
LRRLLNPLGSLGVLSVNGGLIVPLQEEPIPHDSLLAGGVRWFSRALVCVAWE